MLDLGHLGHCQVPSTVIMGLQGLLKQNGAVGDLSLPPARVESGKPHLGALTSGCRFQLFLYMSQGALPTELARSETEKEQRQTDRHTHKPQLSHTHSEDLESQSPNEPGSYAKTLIFLQKSSK